MSILNSNPTVCFIACHDGPASHFATYAEVLKERGYDIHIHATGPALNRFKARGVEVHSPFSLDNLSPQDEDSLAATIAIASSTAHVIITDLGHLFDVKLHKALHVHAANTLRFAYYDNPEPFVPGEYSPIAAEVIKVAENFLFPNANLAEATIYRMPGEEIDFTGKNRFGLGYYPVSQAKKMAEKRKSDHQKVRAEFLLNHGLEDKQQKILVYFGGNNEEYFSKALPAFLSFVAQASELDQASGLTDLENTIIVMQQHPSAKLKNRDGQLIEAWLKEFEKQADKPETIKKPKVIISYFTSDYAQVLADGAFYYQTSMSPQFILAGIPTVQIGHETYEDILVRNQLAPSVTHAEGLIQVIKTLGSQQKPHADLLNGLGIKENWADRLENIIKG